MLLRSRAGFTLIELLVVIVIIMLLLALILPSLVGGICTARQANAQVLITELTGAAQAYWIDQGEYPPGDGSGSEELAYHLSREGPQNLPYFEFLPNMLWRGHIRNPVWGDAGAPRNIVYYRNNQAPAATRLGTSQPPVYRKKTVDMWAAGCDWTESDSSTAWSISNW